jgi:hypothetical protein
MSRTSVRFDFRKSVSYDLEAKRLKEPVGAQRRPALAQEHVAGAGRLLLPDASQRADLAPGERLNAVVRSLAPEHLRRGSQVRI